MKTVYMTVNVRSRGSIGKFTARLFEFQAPESASDEEIRDKWLKMFGDDWESYNVVSISIEPT